MSRNHERMYFNRNLIIRKLFLISNLLIYYNKVDQLAFACLMKCTGALYIYTYIYLNRKAFDTVHHGCLVQKLKCYGINGNELNWYDVYDGFISDPNQVTHGVPQGSILGPLLFIILVNDMSSVLSKCQILMYADDTVLFYADKESGIIQDILNNEAGLVEKWIKDNNLRSNLKKGICNVRIPSKIIKTTQM